MSAVHIFQKRYNVYIGHSVKYTKVEAKYREQVGCSRNEDIALHIVTQTRFALYLDTKTEQILANGMGF